MCNSFDKHTAGNISANLADSMLVFIFLSLFSKLACAPFHLWALDVYEESPTNSSFFFATTTKLSVIILGLKIAFHVFFKLCVIWSASFIIVGSLSSICGAAGGGPTKKT